jgi:hypothetical protein
LLADSDLDGSWVRQIENPAWLVASAHLESIVGRGERVHPAQPAERCEWCGVRYVTGIDVDADEPH